MLTELQEFVDGDAKQALEVCADDIRDYRAYVARKREEDKFHEDCDRLGFARAVANQQERTR